MSPYTVFKRARFDGYILSYVYNGECQVYSYYYCIGKVSDHATEISYSYVQLSRFNPTPPHNYGST